MAKHGENIYKRKDGRYEGRYVTGKTPEGRTRFGYIYGRQYAEVRNRLLQKKAELLGRQGSECFTRRWTLDQWLTYWMENELLGSVKPSSYQTYCNQANRHLRPALGGYFLSELTPGMIHAFVEGLHLPPAFRSHAVCAGRRSPSQKSLSEHSTASGGTRGAAGTQPYRTGKTPWNGL